MTGLAAAMASGAPIFEQSTGPGGICRSYYLRPDGSAPTDHAPPGDDAYRFEVGGGHWIFGGAPEVIDKLGHMVPLKCYERDSTVRIEELGITIPYPLQNHVDRLPPGWAERVIAEWSTAPTGSGDAPTLQTWLAQSFGPTLCDLFFFPFHDRYTAGLTSEVAPQDGYKSPPMRANKAGAGYNATYRYPTGGLDLLVGAMAEHCDIRYSCPVAGIDAAARRLTIADATTFDYDLVISTLPLHRAVAMAAIELDEPADPFTSVLVINIGAERGSACPDTHWQYETGAAAFHRLGFYSNVDPSFLPQHRRRSGSHVSLYVERAFRSDRSPDCAEIDEYVNAVVAELQARSYIREVEVIDPSWVEVAYTWTVPGSTWRQKALDGLAARDIHQVGRYGTWKFQGIADSIRDGLEIGSRLAKGTLGSRSGATVR